MTDIITVHDAVIIGMQQMREYEDSWLCAFYSTISKRVIPAAKNKKYIALGTKKLNDSSMIYSRVIGIQESSKDIDIEDVFSHEKHPVPTSKFEDSGAMRLCKGKSDQRSIWQRKYLINAVLHQ